MAKRKKKTDRKGKARGVATTDGHMMPGMPRMKMPPGMKQMRTMQMPKMG